MEMKGKEVADHLKSSIKACNTNLTIISAGEDRASLTYINTLKKMGAELGIVTHHMTIREHNTTEDVIKCIEELNDDPYVGSIIVMKPLPSRLNSDAICGAISRRKDVDCQNYRSLGSGKLEFPCTPLACLAILDYYGIILEGKKAVVVGRSNVVGKPMAELLLNRNATVTICHSKTKDLKNELLQADIIISATGVPHMITPDMVKKEAVVVDAGISFKDGKICGDVHPDVYDKVYAYTRVPNGVGAVSNAMVFFKHCDSEWLSV